MPPVVVPVLLVVAIVAFLIGNHGSSTPSTVAPSSTPSQPTRTASGSSVILEYPAGWRVTSRAPAMPGLSVSNALLLAPAGNATQAGLLSGQLPAGEPSPLPPAFLALLHTLPRAEVVSLENVQAYRYSGISGYQRTLDLYVIPTVGGTSTALICYAADSDTSYLQQCAQIAQTVALASQTPDTLTPDPGYAGQLRGLIAALESERTRLRAQMPKQPLEIGVLATTLAARFDSTATAVAALEPPLPASAAQAALASALLRARAAYTAVATAFDQKVSLEGAEAEVDQAETGVDKALENFTLLGYTSH